METKFEIYSDMWTSKLQEYMLLEYVSANTHKLTKAIYHMPSNTIFVTGDERLEAFIIDRMMNAGVKVTDKPVR